MILPEGERWIASRGRVVTDARGCPERLAGVSLGITERKRAGAALQESEARFRRLIDANVFGVYRWHTDGQHLDNNEALRKMIGVTREEIRGGRINLGAITSPAWMDVDAQSVAEIWQRVSVRRSRRISCDPMAQPCRC